jgi:hypothetical protein
MAASACVGVISNLVNGLISPEYFRASAGLQEAEAAWRARIAEGLFSGLFGGIFLSVVFTAGVGSITQCSCSYKFAVRYLLGIVLAALACWVFGGIAGVALAVLSPETYGRSFSPAPAVFSGMLAYAWARGSTTGLVAGALGSLAIALVLLQSNWRKMKRHAEQSLAAESR